MRLIFTLIVTCACALSGAKYQSDLHMNTQAAFYMEAERAYRDIIAYDEDAPVTREEILRLYRRDAYFAPVKQMISKARKAIGEKRRLTPGKYAQKCIYEGRILENAPEGVVFVRACLLPFSPSQARAYDEMQKSGDYEALDRLFSPLEDWVYKCRGAYTPENGFDAYFKMNGEDGIIPCAEGCGYLSEEATKNALRLTKERPISPPVRDARGVIVFEFVSG
ncbi:MAG: hypothetical protein IKJ65_03565 [Clostridia bacterium]|nr:hypothetical protein [Clostridia bacterium]